MQRSIDLSAVLDCPCILILQIGNEVKAVKMKIWFHQIRILFL